MIKIPFILLMIKPVNLENTILLKSVKLVSQEVIILLRY